MDERNKMAFSIEQFCELASIGRSLAYKEIESGRLKTKKVGRRTIITLRSALDWLNDLPNGDARNATKVNAEESIRAGG